MTNEKSYNGWTNYETWRVNLEAFDGQSPEDLTGDMNVDVSTLANALKEQAEELIEAGHAASSDSEGLTRDYALAFLSHVDWQEIAEAMADAYADEVSDRRRVTHSPTP